MSLHLEHFHHAPFGNELRELLLRMPTIPARRFDISARCIGFSRKTIAAAVKHLLEQDRVSPQQVLCVGCPGHHSGTTAMAAFRRR